MMKRLFAITMILCLMIALTACGGATNTTAEVTDNTTAVEASTENVSTEEVAEPTSEPTSAPELEESNEEIAEETEPVNEGLSVEVATEKLQKLCDAYNALYDSKDEAAELATRTVYNPEVEPITEGDYHTKDNYSLQNIAVDYDRDYYGMRGILLGALWDYYYDHANNDSTKDYPSYISESTKDDLADIFFKRIEDSEANGGIDTNDYYMNNVVWIPTIISNDGKDVTVENITDTISVEHKSVVMSDLTTADVAFQADIYFKREDSGLKLVFDKDKNLLNINDENMDQSKLVVPFE